MTDFCHSRPVARHMGCEFADTLKDNARGNYTGECQWVMGPQRMNLRTVIIIARLTGNM